MSVPIWTSVTVKLSDLQPWEHNPRTMTKAEAKRLVKSRNKLGQFQTIAIGPDCEVYDGHQRLSAWAVVFGVDSEIMALQSDRPLTDEERRELTLNANEPAGAWNWQIISGWPELPEWGFDQERLMRLNSDAANLATMLGVDEIDEEDDKYSKKVEPPIYTPKGPKPMISDLYDEAKTSELLRNIESSELPEDEKRFLRVAAQRHTVLNFQNIAEYYAHSAAPVQRLMEDSALVIIDFAKAIEQGYVKLSKEILDIQNNAR